MSLVLQQSRGYISEGGTPQAKTYPPLVSPLISIGPLDLTATDFAALVVYVLTNADLAKDDPRIELVETIKRLKITDGFNAGYSRFALEDKNEGS